MTLPWSMRRYKLSLFDIFLTLFVYHCQNKFTQEEGENEKGYFVCDDYEYA